MSIYLRHFYRTKDLCGSRGLLNGERLDALPNLGGLVKSKNAASLCDIDKGHEYVKGDVLVSDLDVN